MSSKTKNVEKSKMEHGRKRKRAAAGDSYMSETIGDSKKPELAAYPGSSEDGCDKV